MSQAGHGISLRCNVNGPLINLHGCHLIRQKCVGRDQRGVWPGFCSDMTLTFLVISNAHLPTWYTVIADGEKVVALGVWPFRESDCPQLIPN